MVDGDSTDRTQKVAEEMKENYIGACMTKPGLIARDSDVYLLPRAKFKDIFTMSFRVFSRL